MHHIDRVFLNKAFDQTNALVVRGNLGFEVGNVIGKVSRPGDKFISLLGLVHQ
jgi:hypothetical protein